MFWDKVKEIAKKVENGIDCVNDKLDRVERKICKGKSIGEKIHYEGYSEKVVEVMLHPVDSVKSVGSAIKEKDISNKVVNKVKAIKENIIATVRREPKEEAVDHDANAESSALLQEFLCRKPISISDDDNQEDDVQFPDWLILQEEKND